MRRRPRTISAQDDLHWLTEEYQSELGIRSSGGTFEAVGLGIHVYTGGAHEVSWKAAVAARRAWNIIRAVNLLKRRERAVLINSYSPPANTPRGYAAEYGDELAGIVKGIRPPKGVVGQAAIITWARLQLDKANRAYLEAKREIDDE